MHLTKRTDYGIRVLMYCALNQDYPNRIAQIAEACCISEFFLFKILQPLGKAGIIETVRGRNGGVRLCRPADRSNHRFRCGKSDRRIFLYGGVFWEA